MKTLHKILCKIYQNKKQKNYVINAIFATYSINKSIFKPIK